MSAAAASSQDLNALRKWLHEVNNRVGVILASAELVQMDPLPPQVATRCKAIEEQALEMREILRAISDHYFS